MATEKRLIDANEFNHSPAFLCGGFPGDPYYDGYCDALDRIQEVLESFPTVDAVEVVHGRWENAGGDLHSSGYAVYCSVCHKNHFVHYKHSLGGLYGCKELFEKPKYCPSCGAVMEIEK